MIVCDTFLKIEIVDDRLLLRFIVHPLLLHLLYPHKYSRYIKPSLQFPLPLFFYVILLTYIYIFILQSRDWDAPNEEPLDASDYDPPPAISPYHGGSTDSKGGAKVASQWGALAAGGHPTPTEAPSSSSRDARDERGYREGERGGYDDERYGGGRGGGYSREPARPRVVPLIDK